jgi:serine/threonine protein kinase
VWDGDELGEVNPEKESGFNQELAIMYRFRETSNFAKLYAYSTWPQMSIIMKYYSGQSLKHYIRSHHARYKHEMIPQDIVFHILKPTCQAIAYMHEAGIIHCDIKSANILLEWQIPARPVLDFSDRFISQSTSMTEEPVYNDAPIPIPYITDFGISYVLDESTSLQVKAFKPVNLQGASLQYSAPEVLNELLHSVKVFKMPTSKEISEEERRCEAQTLMARDTYALACVFYEMLIGRTPWAIKPKT